jgi:hypothetical protein
MPIFKVKSWDLFDKTLLNLTKNSQQEFKNGCPETPQINTNIAHLKAILTLGYGNVHYFKIGLT